MVTTHLSHIEVYETKTRLYVFGKEGSLDRYRVLKFDRTVPPPSQLCFESTLHLIPKDELGLIIDDDGIVYTRNQILALLKMLEEGNGFIHCICKCAGLLGVARFLEGYYLVTITQATQSITLGSHKILKVEATKLIPIVNFSLVKIIKKPEEQHWVESFQTLILQHDFYFSHTYDLTKPLQFNILKHSGAPCFACSSISSSLLESTMYNWNQFLIQLARTSTNLDPIWFVPLIQGFIGQIQLDVFGKRIYVTLIARRSRKFAGARFLRRGLDTEGYVANEVETEQIVHLSSFQFPLFASPPSPFSKFSLFKPLCVLCENQGIQKDGTTRTSFSSLYKAPKQPFFTSFIQHRGSIPLIWSQENGTMTPKPPITLNISDPYFVGASLHFNRMLDHYGVPIIVLNLIKTKEKFKREAILGEEFEMAIHYLNQFLSLKEKIEYHHVDMSFHAKTGKVMDILEDHVEKMVDRIGFFASCSEPVSHSRARDDGSFITSRRQSGVIRTNCIDCLDRTNAAAFVIGKSALARQLLHLGILPTPHIDFDSEAISLLMDLYQAHGDAIAFQYAGSNLVNTMSTYRKGDLVSHSRDLLETIKRYYSSSFTDTEKQDTIDIFLGLGKQTYKVQTFTSIGNPPPYTHWRKHSTPLAYLSSLQTNTSEESKSSSFAEYESFANLLSQECPSSQTGSPFSKHPPHEGFALGGLKKWISSGHQSSSPFTSFEKKEPSLSTSSLVASAKVKLNKEHEKNAQSNEIDTSDLSLSTLHELKTTDFWPVIAEKELAEYECYANQYQSSSFVQSLTQHAQLHPDFWLFKKASSLDVPNVPLESQRFYKAYLNGPEHFQKSFVSSLYDEFLNVALNKT